jgi:hypothetical protein
MLKLVPVLILLAIALPAVAGPPFLTDDPVPIDLHHWEFYTFMTTDSSRGASSTAGPAIELNNGFHRDMMVHLVVPYMSMSTDGQPSERGFGDVEAGLKYRFIHETKDSPEVGAFPLLELPTGDASKGLGNGRTWCKVPVWLQKSRGAWTTYGGGGLAYNPAPGQDNYGFAGWLLQKDLSKQLTLGGELFVQGATAQGGRYEDLWNLGGYYNFTPNFSLLFSGGRTFAGEGHTISYLALYWTWGPKG